MSAEIGNIDKKLVCLTKHAARRLKQRNLSNQEVIEFLESKNYIQYPPSANGVRKIRGTVRHKKVFLVIWESDSKIVIVTGGESDAAEK